MFKAIREVKSWNGSKASITILPPVWRVFQRWQEGFLKLLLGLPSLEACSGCGPGGISASPGAEMLPGDGHGWGDSAFEASRVSEGTKSKRRKGNSPVSPLLRCFHQHRLVQQLILPWVNFFLPFLGSEMIHVALWFLFNWCLFPSLFNLFWFSSSFCDLLSSICLKGQK